MVLYVVRQRAQQSALAEAKALSERSAALLAGRISEEEDEDNGSRRHHHRNNNNDKANNNIDGADAAQSDSDESSSNSSDDDGNIDGPSGVVVHRHAPTDLNRGACVEYTLETMGTHAGCRITERLLHREPLVRYTPLEVTRFVGNQLWRAIFGKKVDKMKHLDNIYFSLVETQLPWHRCPTQPTLTHDGSSGATRGGGVPSTAGSPLTSAPAPGGPIIAPGYSVDGALIDIDVAKQHSRALVEQAQRQLPMPKDVLLYLQGVLVGVVDTLLGPGSQALVSCQAMSGGTDVQCILDFRQCARL
ncbi:transport protein particle (TRAPP) component, putative [Bodo saltans]|uniref:Transport protein particle (TRAPP) component, putative n=1 Tax=Bodo saltans TaxID=75058 RepID=A0A0S4JHR0_BODSA|nr:transport protein particle (TRAPP) component, putative [Bodo saltans]|eukprot:CUG88576.1 transport protein particle (TRAPP) component, putative [Bodo saltans]